MVEVSAISVFHNRSAFVARSIESLLDQTHPDYEVIVVDDGSTDDTWAEIDRFDHARLIKVRQANMGFTRSIDRTIRSSRGRFIAVHGAGDVSLPTRLERQAALLENAEVALASCFIAAADNVYRPAGWDRPAPVPLGPAVSRRNPFSHGEVMYRRDIYDAVGGYRPFFRFAQDRDLWLRMGELGGYAVANEVLYRRYYVPGSVRKDIDHAIQQKRFSAYAAECARIRKATGQDPVDAGTADLQARSGVDWLLLDEFARLGGRALKTGGLSDMKAVLLALGRELARTAKPWPRPAGR